MTTAVPGMRLTLTEHYSRYNHPFAVGFDPSQIDLHPFLAAQAASSQKDVFLVRWYQSVLDGVGRSCGTLKLQSAFFEAAGVDGAKALRTIIADAKRRGHYVILDAKRGDIATTMRAYGEAAFDDLNADALTILPWMGIDVIAALQPWMKRGHGIYTVWLSSNAAGRELQTIKDASGKTLAEVMYRKWETWADHEGIADNCGYVLGATDVPAWATELLREHPQCLLMPGIGAQGGRLTTELKSLIDSHPASLLPISRGILSPEAGAEINSWQDYSDGVEARWNRIMKQWQDLK